MKENYFTLERLSVGYGGKPLIHDICVEMKKGEIVTLIGPNGAGKSTILKSITRQLALIGGRVVCAEKDIHQMPYKELATRMAVVLTERIRTELMTCHDIVASGRYPYTGRLGLLTAEDEEKVDEALREVQALELGGRDFATISDGQRQRILLARAICQEPDVMVLDEPTSFLDVKHKLKLLSILRRMAREKEITVVMSLHEIDLAEKISDKIICVNGEEIFDYGRPEEIFQEETIRRLYDIDNGFFDPLLGSIELPAPTGEPQVMVVSSGGNGIPVYRQLQKGQTPFVAGILYCNDIDYQLARLLATEVITEKPFCPISDETFARALMYLDRCKVVIDAGVEIGPCNSRMQALLDQARAQGKYRDGGQKHDEPLDRH